MNGYSVVEVLVAASLSLLLMAIIWSAFRVLRYASSQINASQEPRKQLRAALANIQNDLRMASYLFPAGDYDINGRTVTLPDAGETAHALAFALPEKATSPLAFSVVVIHPVERTPKDIKTPDARSLNYYKANGIDPPLSDLPGEIDLEALPSNGSLRVFDAYLLPDTGFEAAVSDNRQAVTLTFRLERREERGEVQRSTYQTTLALRNAQ